MTDASAKNQASPSGWTVLWLVILIAIWASNSVAVKIVVRDIPPLRAGGLRFLLALPLVFIFVRPRVSRWMLNGKEVLGISVSCLLSLAQLWTFNYGSQHTTGGRIGLFLFSYPVLVHLLTPLFFAGERIRLQVLVAMALALVGISVPLREALSGNVTATLKGDLIEWASGLFLAVFVLHNKWLCCRMNIWKIQWWRCTFLTVIFFLLSLATEEFSFASAKGDAWAWLLYQGWVISVFCFLSYQYIISRHGATAISAYFFATPLLGILFGILLLGEPFDVFLILGGLLVAGGIYWANRSAKPG